MDQGCLVSSDLASLWLFQPSQSPVSSHDLSIYQGQGDTGLPTLEHTHGATKNPCRIDKSYSTLASQFWIRTSKHNKVFYSVYCFRSLRLDKNHRSDENASSRRLPNVSDAWETRDTSLTPVILTPHSQRARMNIVGSYLCIFITNPGSCIAPAGIFLSLGANPSIWFKIPLNTLRGHNWRQSSRFIAGCREQSHFSLWVSCILRLVRPYWDLCEGKASGIIIWLNRLCN